MEASEHALVGWRGGQPQRVDPTEMSEARRDPAQPPRGPSRPTGSMRRPFDRLAKDALLELLRDGSRTLVPERETVGEALRVDLLCEPDPDRLDTLAPLGIVQTMVALGPCAFEFFHRSPSLDELLTCVRKSSLLRRPARLPARAEEPWLWVIASGRPGRSMSALHVDRDAGWPPGFYVAPLALRLRLVITSELLDTPDTLLLRLLGRGATLQRAKQQMVNLPARHPIRRTVWPLMVRLRLTTQNRSYLMETQDVYELWQQKVLAEGRAEGRAEAVLRVLEARGIPASDEQAAMIRACTDLAQLDVWLARAATASSVGDILG